MADPLATASHYKNLHGEPGSDRLEALLAKASRIIRAEFKRAGLDIDQRVADGTTDKDLVADVACDMAAYILNGPGAGIVGATSTSQTAGPFSHTIQLSSPSGAMILTRAHRRLLGLPAQTAWQADLLPAGRTL